VIARDQNLSTIAEGERDYLRMACRCKSSARVDPGVLVLARNARELAQLAKIRLDEINAFFGSAANSGLEVSGTNFSNGKSSPPASFCAVSTTAIPAPIRANADKDEERTRDARGALWVGGSQHVPP
jgi:hypothetical protein